MDIKQEIQQLKDEEQSFASSAVSKKGKTKRQVSFELWPFIPVLVCLVLLKSFAESGLDLNFWQFWWLIFLVKPLSKGLRSNKGWNKQCQTKIAS